MPLPALDTLQALLLDLDDTILDDRSGILGAWKSTIDFVVSERRDVDAEEFGQAIQQTTRWFWSDPERERRGRLDLPKARAEIVGGALKRLSVIDPRLAARAGQHYTDYRETTYKLAPGAAKALARLRVRVPKLALVTNGAAHPQRAKIERFSLGGWFDHIQVEGEFGLGKPEPDVYHHVVASLRVDPSACLMVGDNHRCDVRGAIDAGLHAAWIDVEGLGAPPQPAARPHASVRSLVELAERLGC